MGRGGSTDPSAQARSVNMSSCMPSSPSSSSSWRAPANRHRGATIVRRLQLDAAVGWCGHRAWRKLLRRLVQETKCICTSPSAASRPITFGYDAASYAKNFDDGRRPAPYAIAAPAAAAEKTASL